MENALKRNIARILLRGREDRLTRVALASKFARFYAAERKNIVGHRYDLYNMVQEQTQPKPIDYLEFGVYEGDSISHIAELNKHPESRFIGFDSFEGLPEDWNKHKTKGTFSTEGSLPELTDPRVQFVKGWFDTTLPEFTRTFHSQGTTWIHIDCDLYSSTMTALVSLNYLIKPGSFIIFDEFEDIAHEFRAFLDFQEISAKSFTVLGATKHFRQVAVKCVQ